MNLASRQFLHLAAVLVCIAGNATAQVYPSRPITVVVPFAAGGPTETIGRIMAERLQASLGQRLIMENVSGAAGTTGVGRGASAAGDGESQYSTVFRRECFQSFIDLSISRQLPLA